jgi:uncharacterized coiled-coil DUF342 family protein
MRHLPDDILSHIFVYVPPQWLCTCSRHYASVFFKQTRQFYLVRWFRLYKQKNAYVNSMKELKNTVAHLRYNPPSFHTFRDVEKYKNMLLEHEFLLNDMRYHVNTMHNRLQNISKNVDYPMTYLVRVYHKIHEAEKSLQSAP